MMQRHSYDFVCQYLASHFLSIAFSQYFNISISTYVRLQWLTVAYQFFQEKRAPYYKC